LESNRIVAVRTTNVEQKKRTKTYDRVTINNIATTINIKRALNFQDINRGHRVLHDRNAGAQTSLKPY
jgi:hypothetical protein